MDTQKETTFRFNSNILDRVLITKATLQTTDENDMLINQFALNGYLSFQTIRQRNQAPIDIFLLELKSQETEERTRSPLIQVCAFQIPL